MLVRVMRLLGWNIAVTSGRGNAFLTAEQELLDYVLMDSYDPWAELFTDVQLKTAIAAIQALFKTQSTGYKPPDANVLERLVERIVRGIPPVLVDVNEYGNPCPHLIDISQTLYAGWIFWVGRQHFRDAIPNNFLDTNRLCDLALLQQCAINIARSPE
jgi:hypothetical protein